MLSFLEKLEGEMWKNSEVANSWAQPYVFMTFHLLEGNSPWACCCHHHNHYHCHCILFFRNVFIVPNGLNGLSIDSVMLGFIKNEVITVDILVIVSEIKSKCNYIDRKSVV